MSDALWLVLALASAVAVLGGAVVGLVLGEVRWAGPGRSELSRLVDLLTGQQRGPGARSHHRRADRRKALGAAPPAAPLETVGRAARDWPRRH